MRVAMSRWWRDQSGQTLVIAALSLVALMLVLGLLVDGGNVMTQRRLVQNAADAAALAGARQLAAGAGQAATQASIEEYAITRNGATGVNVTYLPGSTKLKVVVTKDTPTYFMGIAGIRSVRLQAEATAEILGGGNDCMGGVAIWAEETDASLTGSGTVVNGSVHANRDLTWTGSGVTVVGNIFVNRDSKMTASNNVVTGTLSITDNTVTGKFHANGSWSATGSNNTFGVCEYGTWSSVTGSGVVFNPPLPGNLRKVGQVDPPPLPVTYDINDYKPGGKAAVAAAAAGKYHYYSGNMRVTQSNTTLDGLYYVAGNVQLTGSNLHGVFTIVAQGPIDQTGSAGGLTPYADGLLFFSNAGNVKLTGSGTTWGGIVYGPAGTVTMTGSNNFTFRGALIGGAVTATGSGLTVQYDSQYCPAGSGTSVIKLTK